MDCTQSFDSRGCEQFFSYIICRNSTVMCQKALFLPNIVGKSLDDGTKKDTTTMCFGRITILAMLGTQISEVVVNLQYLLELY
jgi:hypothetical protein